MPITKRAKITCPSCEIDLVKVDYTSYGRKLWSETEGKYVEDYSWGAGELDFACPECSAPLELNEEELELLL